MNRKMIVFLLFAGFFHQALAGYIINVEYHDYAGAPSESCRLMTFLEGRTMKIDTTCVAGYRSALTFDADAGTIRQIRYPEKSYLELDTRKLGALQNGLQGTADFLQTQLDRYDVELFEKSEKKKHHYRVEKTKRKRTINGLNCRQVIIHEDSVPVQEVWYANWEEAGIRKSDLYCLLKLGAFYESLWTTPGTGSVTASMLRVPLDGIIGLTGYPVEINMLKNSKIQLMIKLGRPRKANLSPDIFAVPTGYKRSWM